MDVLSTDSSHLRIGIDASRIISTAPTGTEGYSYHLLQALVPLLRKRFDISLYFRQSPSIDFLGEIDSRVIPFPRLWTHIRLSWEMVQRSPDLLFVPAHVLPLIHPHRSLVTVHDLGYRYFPSAHPVMQRIYLDLSTRWNVHTASHVLADSKATRDAIVKEYHVAPNKITIVYPGYDSDLSSQDNEEKLAIVRNRYGIQDDYILHIGRIHPRKNLKRLISAFQMLLPAYPRIQLVLAGPKGWFSESILSHIEKQNLHHNVILTGYIAENDKADLISGARVFAYPSLYEGFGFPALEAQACGTPLLTSTTSSMPEVAGNGALLVDPENVEAIRAGLQTLLENEEIRQMCILQGYQNLQRFSWQKTALKVQEIIEAQFTQ